MTKAEETTSFSDLHDALRRTLEARGVRVVLDDLVDARCLLFTCPDPSLRTLVVSRKFHTYGRDAVALYYDVLGHLLSHELDAPLTLIVEREPSAESEVARAAHRGAHELGRTLYWDCIEGVDDWPALLGRLTQLGMDNADQALSLCQIIPGSRKRLRHYLKRFGKSRTAGAWDFGLSLLQVLYRRMPKAFVERTRDTPLVAGAHEMKVAIELRNAIPPPKAEDRAA